MILGGSHQKQNTQLVLHCPLWRTSLEICLWREARIYLRKRMKSMPQQNLIDSGSGSVSEAGKMDITNEEACIIFILLISFTNYNSLQLEDSLPRQFIAENTCNKKLRSKKWMA